MPEERVFFNSGKIKLEGLLCNQPWDKGVVVSHPHPLHGGDMYNNVVDAICKAYQGKGYSTLRFNFRGAGMSEGEYDEGIGEQDDVKEAIAFLAESGKKDIDLAGYSFGSWVNAIGLNKYENIIQVVMVSPPVDLMDFSSINSDSRIKLVISGSEDEIADTGSIEKVISSWNKDAEFKIIQGTDHFYRDKTAELQKVIGDFLTT